MNQLAVASHTQELSDAVFKNLLVAYDASEASETALQYAITLAHNFGSVVTVVSVLPPSDLAIEMEGGFGRWQAHRQTIENLEEVGKRLAAQGIRNRLVHRAGSVADVLVQLAAENKVDLLLLGAYGHQRMDHPRLGSTVEFMLRSMPCGVLTIGPGAVLHGRPVPLTRTLLYASSLPTRMRPARRILMAWAKKSGSHVEIIHVIDPQVEAHDPRNYAQMRAAENALSKELHEAGVNAAWSLITGPQAERIIERSDAIHANLILFGLEHIQPRFEIVGAISTTIWRASCPVLTVPGPA
jgi:nucleotide-binding universal stress UspA family protein